MCELIPANVDGVIENVDEYGEDGELFEAGQDDSEECDELPYEGADQQNPDEFIDQYSDNYTNPNDFDPETDPRSIPNLPQDLIVEEPNPNEPDIIK